MRKAFAFIFSAWLLWSGVSAFAAPLRADKILIEKAARRLTLFREGKAVKTYQVSLGREPLGAKQQEGDGKTPEGSYWIDARNPNSAFHLSLRISYPNARDRNQAAARGVSPGGQIMIHGLPNGASNLAKNWYGSLDWTNGCIAVQNHEIEEIWRLVPNQTPVEIVP